METLNLTNITAETYREESGAVHVDAVVWTTAAGKKTFTIHADSAREVEEFLNAVRAAILPKR